MALVKFSSAHIEAYLSGDYLQPGQVECINAASDIAVHAYGRYPGALISERRPSESDTVHLYRLSMSQLQKKR